MIMITVYRENGKPFSDEILIIVVEAQKSFKPTEATCAGCGAKGFLVYYCPYRRFLDVLVNGAPATDELALERYQCSICKKTHVVAPGELVIPYARHSLGFILAVLEAYAKKEKPVRQIAVEFRIVVSTLYAWARKFHEHCELMLGKLEAPPDDIAKPLEAILDEPALAHVLFIFAETFLKCFLQTKRQCKTTRCFTLRGFLSSRPGRPP